jgi:Domain of unknown function (DUF4440)
MKVSFAILRTLLLSLLCVLCSVRAGPQTPPALEKITSQAELEKTIAMLDTALFDAYNRCDLEKFASLLSENVEFYHDERGLTVGKETLADSVKQHACGRVTREPVPGSLNVHRMEGFGALEMGIQRFRHSGTEPADEGKFIYLWQCKDGTWKITRLIIYDYHAVPK